MADPTTSNILLTVPTRGSDPGTWDVPVNNNSLALDGFFGGVQTISVSNANFSLTAPAGVVTPGGGPTQSQNAVLRFTGTLTANVQVTLPLPGYYIVENLSTGNFVLTFRAVGIGQIIAVDQGEILHLYNDGTNVRFVNLGRIGHLEIWAGLIAMPAWVTACTVAPYLLCDGSIYNFSTFPALGARLLGAFGGNGVTTFGVPDSRGRLPLAYDGTGTRITVAGCGLNGQTLGGALDKQTNTLLTANLPPYTPSGTLSLGSGSLTGTANFGSQPIISGQGAGIGGGGAFGVNGGTNVVISGNPSGSFNGLAQGGINTPVNNVQPSQVTGIAVIRAA